MTITFLSWKRQLWLGSNYLYDYQLSWEDGQDTNSFKSLSRTWPPPIRLNSQQIYRGRHVNSCPVCSGAAWHSMPSFLSDWWPDCLTWAYLTPPASGSENIFLTTPKGSSFDPTSPRLSSDFFLGCVLSPRPVTYHWATFWGWVSHNKVKGREEHQIFVFSWQKNSVPDSSQSNNINQLVLFLYSTS